MEGESCFLGRCSYRFLDPWPAQIFLNNQLPRDSTCLDRGDTVARSNLYRLVPRDLVRECRGQNKGRSLPKLSAANRRLCRPYTGNTHTTRKEMVGERQEVLERLIAPNGDHLHTILVDRARVFMNGEVEGAQEPGTGADG